MAWIVADGVEKLTGIQVEGEAGGVRHVSQAHCLELHVQFLFSNTLCCGVHEMLAGVFYFKQHVFVVGGRYKENELLSGGVELGEAVLLLCLLLFLEY
jgi:hypothetical protein